MTKRIGRFEFDGTFDSGGFPRRIDILMDHANGDARVYELPMSRSGCGRSGVRAEPASKARSPGAKEMTGKTLRGYRITKSGKVEKISGYRLDAKQPVTRQKQANETD